MLSQLYMIAFFASLMRTTEAAPAFSGDFILSDLDISSPFQTNPNSTANSTFTFDFSDQDLPDSAPIRCSVEWAVGLSPPQTARLNSCEDPGVSVWFPEGSYRGTKNLTLAISHTYEDDTVGAYPYNQLTKIAEVNLTYPGSTNFECDADESHCKSCDGTTIIARVLRTIA